MLSMKVINQGQASPMAMLTVTQKQTYDTGKERWETSQS